MAKGYRSAGVDFDDLFDPDVMGDGPSVPNMRSGGVAQRYAALAYGTKRANVGYRQAGVDVSNLWAAKGTARYALDFDGKTYTATDTALSGATGTTSATLELRFLPAGTWEIRRQLSAQQSEVVESGTWLPAGESAAAWSVQFGATAGTGQGTVTNGAPSYAALSSVRSISLEASINSATFGIRSDSRAVSALLRKGTGTATTSTATFDVTAQGQV